MSEEKKGLPLEVKERLKAEFTKEWRKDLRKSIPVKERMKMERRKMPERPPDVRNKVFKEVNLGLSVCHRLPRADRHPLLHQAD
jgi:hypothetical protein